MLISQLTQRHRSHPQGASRKTGIGERRSPTCRLYVLLSGRQCRSRPYLPQAGFYSHLSRDMYDSRAHHPSYTKSPRQLYAAPRGTSRQTHDKDRLNDESARSSWRKKEVVKQVYRVKKDGRKCVDSDSTPSIKKPTELTLAIKGKELR